VLCLLLSHRGSLVRTAFVAAYVPDEDVFERFGHAVGGCGPEDCVRTLTVHLLVVICTQVVGSCAFNYWLPYLARMLYHCSWDVRVWWTTIAGACLGCYECLSAALECFLSTWIGACIGGGFSCLYQCLCGAPAPRAVPLVRTNLGQSIDRSTKGHGNEDEEGAGRGGGRAFGDEDDDVSDLDDEFTVQESKNGTVASAGAGAGTGEAGKSGERRGPLSPQPLRSMTELRVGLTSHTAVGASGGTPKGPGGKQSAVRSANMSRQDTLVGVEDLGIENSNAMEGYDAAAEEKDQLAASFEADELFNRAYKYDQGHQLRRCYARIVLLVALLTCFGTMLPAIYVAGAAFFYFEVKGKAWQLTSLYKRLFPFEAEGIGACWNDILDVITTLSILTNAALVCFLMKQFSHWSWVHRLCLFIGITFTGFMYRFCLANFCFSKQPPEVVIQQRRAEFLTDKLIYQVADKSDNFAHDIL
jgi:hypothetical protein